ncbi:hypothetical protein phiPsal1_051 [Pontimonas phage phiPsal1]|nr:hypothetical protein phiPsal1_051 [Pontimonas phage phiPsal1]
MIWHLVISFIGLVFGLPAAYWFIQWAYEYGGMFLGLPALGLVMFAIVAGFAISLELRSY